MLLSGPGSSPVSPVGAARPTINNTINSPASQFHHAVCTQGARQPLHLVLTGMIGHQGKGLGAVLAEGCPVCRGGTSTPFSHRKIANRTRATHHPCFPGRASPARPGRPAGKAGGALARPPLPAQGRALPGNPTRGTHPLPPRIGQENGHYWPSQPPPRLLPDHVAPPVASAGRGPQRRGRKWRSERLAVGFTAAGASVCGPFPPSLRTPARLSPCTRGAPRASTAWATAGAAGRSRAPAPGPSAAPQSWATG